MRTTHRPALRATSVAVAATLLTALAAPAWAAASDDPQDDGATVTVSGDTTTITVDTARLEELCGRVPQAIRRLDGLVTRIAADEGTRGSSAWLHAEADEARTAGREAAADRLDARAELRQSRVATLQAAADRLRQAEETVCSQLGES